MSCLQLEHLLGLFVEVADILVYSSVPVNFDARMPFSDRLESVLLADILDLFPFIVFFREVRCCATIRHSYAILFCFRLRQAFSRC